MTLAEYQSNFNDNESAEMFAGLHDPHRAAKKESLRFRQSQECEALRGLVKAALMFPFYTSWTVQGFGMLRTYLPIKPNAKRFRLNVWHSALSVPGVSILHDHPWSFDSWVINGNFRNVRYVEDYYSGEHFDFMNIKCGEDGCAMSDPAAVRLCAMPTEFYTTGDKYHQDAAEIHASFYDDGTVTLNDRTGDTEHARVFWPHGLKWVDAKPRPATPIEIMAATEFTLAKWQDEVSTGE